MDLNEEVSRRNAVSHMQRATEHLRDSIALHDAEMAGMIDSDTALPYVIDFNRRAIAEGEVATKAINDFLD